MKLGSLGVGVHIEKDGQAISLTEGEARQLFAELRRRYESDDPEEGKLDDLIHALRGDRVAWERYQEGKR